MNHDPQLSFADDGSPRSGRFGDIYYSLEDGLAESRAVFLDGCRLPGDWAGFEDFTVLELGFGTGLNIAALMQTWVAHRPAGGHLHVFSVEGFLMPAEAAGRALAAWPELGPYAAALLAQWPSKSEKGSRRGFHYMDFPQWGVSVTLGLMDVRAALAAWQGQANAIFLDGFSPALNPDMWGDDVLAAVAAHARPGARLGTFTVAGSVRRGLQAAGFTVRKCPGYGRKRQRLEALYTPSHGYAVAHRPKRVAVVGAGIAGCALAWQARLFGVGLDLFEAEGAGAGASGNEAALVTPRLDAGDNAVSHLYADAFAYGAALYRRLCPDAILGEGVLQAEMTAKDAARFARIARQDAFAPGDLAVFAKGEAADLPHSAGIALDTALRIRPQTVLDALLDGQAPVRARVTGNDERFLTDDAGQVHGPYDAVVWACGAGMFDTAHGADFDLRPVRGQVEAVVSDDPPGSALSWGGYAVPLPDGMLFGATHERGDRGCDIRAEDRARNLDNLARVMPRRAAALAAGPFRSRASVRVMTRDYLPVAGRAGEGTWLLTGLGARGFCLAPLLARAVLADILGVASPLPAVAKNLLAPERLTQPGRP